MNIFVINSGSSSIKYQLISMPEAQVLCSGLVDRIGLEGSKVEHKSYLIQGEVKKVLEIPVPHHSAGLQEVVKLLIDPEIGVISDPSEVEVVGHRVVHGGEKFASTQVITDEVKAKIKALFSLGHLA